MAGLIPHWGRGMCRIGFPILLTAFALASCAPDNDDNMQWMEQQITTGEYGHFLNPVQAFSPDGIWLVYDTRNDDTHIGRTGSIERVHLRTGDIEKVYTVPHQTIHGPGVGAVAYSPVADRVIFIHGLANSNARQPYGVTRRTGVVVSMDEPGVGRHFDARNIRPPFTPGALRGGSHAHSWSGDGACVSFTYNDEIMHRLSQQDSSAMDLRTVGVMMPWGAVEVPPDEAGEHHSGEMFSMVVARVTPDPTWGSDEISKAYEDGWVGHRGYEDGNGQYHRWAVAFLGDVRSREGEVVTEVFVVDLPEERPSLENENQICGGIDSRPEPLSFIRQRRVTFTTDRTFPGVQGPRQWMKSSPDGQHLYFMMKDDAGLVQLFSVPTIGGALRQITDLPAGITTSFDIDPSGKRAAFGVGEEVYVVDIPTGQATNLTPRVPEAYTQLRAIQWSKSGRTLAYNRLIPSGDTAYFQIFTLTIPDYV